MKKNINERPRNVSRTINRNADNGSNTEPVNENTDNTEIIELDDTEAQKGAKSRLFSVASKMGMGNADGTYNLKPFLWGIGLSTVIIFGAQHAIKEGWIKIGK